MRRPAQRYPLVVDSDVGMMIGGLRELGCAVDESDRTAEVAELELPLERAVDLPPALWNAHTLQYGAVA